MFRLHSHVRLAHFVRVEELVRRTLVNDSARLKDIAAVGDYQRLVNHLLDQRDGDAAFGYFAYGLKHAFDKARLETERELVEEYELRTGHQAARYRAHLLLSPAHRLRGLLGAVL